MSARIKNPIHYLPEAQPMLMGLGDLPKGHGVPDATLELTHLRVSQINGCAWCLDFGVRNATKAGESTERLALIAAWREATCYDDAERAALALAESMTRLADGAGVPDEIWDEAAAHYDEEALAALVTWVATTNLYNRVNVTIRSVPGTW